MNIPGMMNNPNMMNMGMMNNSNIMGNMSNMNGMGMMNDMNNMNGMGMMNNLGGNMGMNPMMSNMGGNMGMNPMMSNMGGNMGVNPIMGNMGMNNPMMMNNNVCMNPMMNNMAMNPMMGMNPMMNNMAMNPMMNNMGMTGIGIPQMTQSVSIEDQDGWNLLFENTNNRKIINIRISPDKLVKEVISAYLLKINETNVGDFRFIFNNKPLQGELKISQTGLTNGAKILVISQKNLKGAR